MLSEHLSRNSTRELLDKVHNPTSPGDFDLQEDDDGVSKFQSEEFYWCFAVKKTAEIILTIQCFLWKRKTNFCFVYIFLGFIWNHTNESVFPKIKKNNFLICLYFPRFYKMFPEEYLHRTLHKAVQHAIVWNSKVRKIHVSVMWLLSVLLLLLVIHVNWVYLINCNIFYLKFSFFTVNIPTEHVSSLGSTSSYFIWWIYKASLLKHWKVWSLTGLCPECLYQQPCSLSWFLNLAKYHIL